MILSAHQPQYLAYTGYFDKIDQADIFVLLDTVQYKKNEWINRNRLKTPNGAQFITVPVSFKFGDAIKDVAIALNIPWQKKHLQTIRTYYSKTPYFDTFFETLENVLQQNFEFLGELNIKLIREISSLLGIDTCLEVSSKLPEMLVEPDLRLISLCKHFACNTYLAGAGGKDYMNLSVWEEHGVKVVFQRFEESERSQLFGDFIPNLSIADLFMNEGGQSTKILRQARKTCLD